MRSSTARSGSNSTDDRRSVVSGNSSTASTLVADSLASGKTATSQLRKFTAGVGRPGLAREARDAVRAALVAQNPLRKAPISEPVDYEKFVNERSIQLENDPQREIVLCPRDDIEVTENCENLESSIQQECETAIPMVKPSDIKQAKWLLTREALRFYTQPHRSITFNYANFSGDYSANNTSSCIENETLSSLVFESDMALEDERAAYGASLGIGSVGIVKVSKILEFWLKIRESGPKFPNFGSFFIKFGVYLNPKARFQEGNLNILKSDTPTFIDNLKSWSSKKRYCILRRLEGGECTFEIRKAAQEAPKIAPLKIGSAHIKSTKKGKTVLEIRGGIDEKSACILLESEETQSLEDWLVALQTAIAFANKEDALSICSELDKGGTSKSSDANNAVATSSSSSAINGKSKGADTESIGSEDSSNSRTSEMQPWRGRNSAARALQPPIVDRRNMFSLYYRLQPLPSPSFDPSTILQGSQGTKRPSFTEIPSFSPVKMRKSSSLKRETAQNRSMHQNPLLISIEFHGISIRLPNQNGILHQIEPFFVRFFVFDALDGRRICEEFQILVNGDDLHVSEPVFDSSCLVNGIKRSLLVERTANRALLQLPPTTQNHKDLWLVVRVDRGLSADTAAELYMKACSDAKTVAKLQKTISQSMTRLAGHRQRFAWTAKPLFPEFRSDVFTTSGSTSSTLTSPTTTVSGWSRTSSDCLQLFRCEPNRYSDVDLQKSLLEFSKLEKQSKLMVPNASISVAVNTRASITDYLNRVNPSLYPLNPWKPDDSKGGPPVFQLQSFGDQPSHPHTTLTNLLYVYPMSLKYDSQKAFSKARNISCNVRFVRGDQAIPEKAMVDRMSPSGPYCISSTCSIQHHQQNPVFGEEMKTQLPLNLTTSDHLLFSFSHISVAGNSNLKSSESTETPIGYSWLPLVWKKDRLIMDNDEQEFALPVACDLPANYYRSKPTGMAGKGEESHLSEVRWVDQKPLFRVRLRLCSSVFTTDSKLQTFFQACDRLSAKGIIGDAADSLKRMVKSKSSSPPSDLQQQQHPRSCSPIADSMQRSLSLEDPDQHPHMKHLLQAIRLLSDVPFDRLLVYFPIVLGRLFAILPQAPTDQLAIATLRSIISICDLCQQNGRPRVVRRFVRHNFSDAAAREQFVSHDATIYAVICRHLPTLMREMQSEPPEELSKLYRQLWVLTDAVVASMSQTICAEQLNKISQRDRFPPEILEQMGHLLEVAVPQIVLKHKEMKEESRCANLALAYFTRFALSFVDRGVVFRWIHFYISRLDDTDFRALRDYKTDLLEILCLHEHFVPLNLPVLINCSSQIQRLNYSGGVIDSQMQTTNSSGAGFLSRFFNQIFNTPTLETNETDRYASCSGEWHLSPSFAQNHFIVGLLLQELVACIRETKDYRKRPISLLRNLLAKHSFDKRYGDMTIQRRISMLYAPVLTFALDHLHELIYEDSDDVDATPTGYRSFPTHHHSTMASLASAKSILRSSGANRYTEFSRGSPVRTSSPVPSTHSTSRPPQMPPPPPIGGQKTVPPPPSSSTPLVEKLTEDEIQDILICCVFILQRMPKRILAALWSENEGANAEKMIKLLELIVDVFRYRGKEHALRRTAANSKTRSQFTLNLPGRASTSNRMSAEMMDEDPNASGSTNSIPFRVLQLVNLSQEVALIVLDVAQTFAHQLAASQRHRHWPHSESLFHSLLSLHLRLADEHWSESVRLHVIAGLALFVNLFRARLFEGGPLEPLYMLIEKVLIQMASRLPAVQAAAAALLQLILRNGYEVAQGYFASQILAQSVSPSTKINNQANGGRKGVSSERLGRPGSQTGVALARLLGFQSVLSNSAAFERGLSAVEALVDQRKATSFDLAVLDLLRQLRGVMTATVALKDAANDPIRLADLHLQLADSYRGSAALRSAWFDTLAELYEQDRWFAEAAVCHAHSVAIIARELEERKDLEVDWRVFEWINNQISETEQSQGGDAGNVQPAGFTTENLGAKIDKTAAALLLAERFEAVGPLYRLIVPVLERNMNFTSLVSVYAELQQTYSRAAEVRSSGKRHLGTYFRVRFYGENHFKQEHNTDWIYREMGLTSLAAFALEVKEKCQRQVGHDRVQIEANEHLDMAKIDPTVAYVQITHVEPSVSADSASSSPRPPTVSNDFVLHTNLSEFSYECAMVENERKVSKEPAIHEQILKRTVIRVSLGGFPSTRRRLPVISVNYEQFSPLEFACQKLNTKAEQIRKTLSAASNGRRLDVKGLQLLLQGAVLPTVNAGPLAYAEVFTKDEQREKYGDEAIVKLRESFRNLMSACQLAIEANASAIGSDQQTYHEVLVSSFDAMHERLQTFFGASLRGNLEPDPSQLPRSAMHILDMMGGVRN
ncbi:Protein CBG04359 [Caenorhabditis briggsae]|uniref:Protein CBG04359 n=1 Tax=Caenorhabditis briggsae TaxID=6238 RepID=A8WXC6_CAEBR|nr:Protein CBG04359 [Caenorhabditis briggsae]CAP25082.2 Protein CBG04359 [Caenorhabditis briggsae]